MKIFFCFLFFVVFLTEIATDIYIPSLAILPKELGTTVQKVHDTMSFHLLGFALGQFIYGGLSDHLGRIKILFYGIFIFCVSSMGCALSGSINQLVFFRFLQGIGACAGPVIGLAIIQDKSTNNTHNIKMISLLTMIVSLSPILGPVIGMIFLKYLGWYSNFWIIAITAGTTLPLLYLQSRRQKNELAYDALAKLQSGFNPATLLSISGSSQTVYGERRDELALKSSKFGTKMSFVRSLEIKKLYPFFWNVYKKYFVPQFLRWVFINALLVSCVWMFITEAPFILMHRYGVSLFDYGIYQAGTVIAYILGGWFSNIMVSKWSIDRLLNIGLIITVFAVSCLFMLYAFHFTTAFNFVFSIAFFEFGLGIARPSIIVKIMSFRTENHGIAAAFIGTSEMIISAFFITLLSKFTDDSLLLVDFFISITVVISLVLHFFYRKYPLKNF